MFSGGNRDEKRFKKSYPEGLLVGHVDFNEPHSKLKPNDWFRTKDQIWEVGFKPKLAKALLHWIEGNSMTPPLIHIFKDNLNIGDGSHRLSVCVAKEVEVIPILILPSEKSKIQELLQTFTLLD